jgi:hypothetical protein
MMVTVSLKGILAAHRRRAVCFIAGESGERGAASHAARSLPMRQSELLAQRSLA